ncbi:hypothetical protein ABMA28_005122 [Loxostege sticticalis]|uniref:RNA-directed DNA polymerase n=1 Tax=Loxostege sticticalis TaxID=481309 RepID=A0ABD0SPE4_LOXSC
MASGTRSKSGAARDLESSDDDATGTPSAVAGGCDVTQYDAERPEPAAPNATRDVPGAFMTETQVSSLLEAFARSQQQANRILFESILTTLNRTTSTGPEVPLPPSPPMTAHETQYRSGSFAKCTARFDGRADDADKLEAFLDAIITYKECLSVSDEHALRGLPILLEDDAAVWWRGIKNSVHTWDDAVARLRGMYGAARPAYKILREIFAQEQGQQRCDVFISRTRALIAKLPYELDECIQIDFVYGLLDRRVRKRITRESVVSLDQLVDRAREFEESLAEVTHGDAGKGPRGTTGTHPKPKPTVSSNPHTYNVNVPPVASSSGLNDAKASSRNRTRCSFCRKFGHVVEDCRNLADKNASKSKDNDTENNSVKRSSAIRCYGCGQQGVIKSKCETCNPRSQVDFHTLGTPRRSVVKRQKPPSYHSKHAIQCVNHDVRDIHPVRPDFAERSGNGPICSRNTINTQETCEIERKPSDLEFEFFRYFREIADFEAKCSLKSSSEFNSTQTKGAPHNNCIFPNLTLYTAGVDFDQFKPIIDVKILGRNGVAVMDTGATNCLASPLLYRTLVDGGVRFTETQRSIGLADGTQQVRDVLTGDVSVELHGRKIFTTFLVIPGANTRTLLGRDFIRDAGIIIDIQQASWHFADTPDRRHGFVKDYELTSAADAELMRVEATELKLRDDEGVNLSDEQRDRLDELIAKHADRFAPDGKPTDFATHHIKTDEKQEPIASPPYRLSQGKKQLLEVELDKLLRADIIEECESPWAANVVLVTKKDGGVRLCVDYRRLNAVTEPDRYPLPRMDDVLHAAKTSNFMSTLDLRSGYFQVSVAEEDRDKTAFISPLGTYRFKRMPMGLRNSGATFQRLMDRFKSNIRGDVSVLCYLDDLIVLSESYERHLEDLEAVFERLALFSLRINREKSFFARDSVKFLGHLIVPGGIQVDPDKTAAITSLPPPRNLKHLKCFLQTTSWFRRFIPNYAEVARPLTILLKKDSSWRWTPEQQSAFEQLRQLLVSAPILRQADETQPYKLRTDSSGYCLGAVLMQGEGPDERPIEYASRLLTAAERNYTTTEREALAVVWAVTKFRGYIEGSEVIVVSDHQPLRWLMSVKSPSGRLARWALTLQEYNLRIDHVPGKANVVADTLSRPACTEEVSCDLCLTVVDLPTQSVTELRKQQLLDPDVKRIIDDLEAEDEPFRGRQWANRGYVMSDGVLYRCGPESDENDDACLVVPTSERAKILAEFHDSPTAGHMGVERTMHRISSRFYWPGMRATVTEYVKNCVPCQRYKADNRKPAGLLQSPAGARRFEVISIDLFGPLPETPAGNRWILIVEDVCSRWIELFALKKATSVECAKTLIEEVLLRFGVPRRMVSDNGVQFVSEIMQQVCYTFGIDQCLTPFYHPEANPVERKNRDLKPQLAILVGRDHSSWDEYLASVRFAMNSALCSSTGYSPAFLTFGREMRAPADALTDMREIVENDKFVANISTYLRKLSSALLDARDSQEKAQAMQKKYADEGRRPPPDYKVGDLVLLKTQGLNDTGRGQTPKFNPRRDGPYKISKVLSDTTYLLEGESGTLGKYHVSHLTPFVGHVQPPVREKRRRGRPRKS